MNQKLKLFLPSLIFFTAANAQSNGFFSYSSTGIQYFRGSGIGNTFKRLRDSDPVSGEIYYQRQINPGPAWNNTKRLPQWGVGIFAANPGSKKYVGAIAAMYPYISFPLVTLPGFQSNFRFGFGLAWVQKPYDKITNPPNLLVSQKINTNANLSWQNEIKINSRHFINTALSLYHVSNAKTSLPNLGINIPSISVGYRYAFNGEKKKPLQMQQSFDKKIFYKTFLSAGIKQMPKPDSSYFFVKVLSGEASKQISYSSILSAGMFITFDASLRTDSLVKDLRSIQTSQVGMYSSYEYSFGRFTIPVQLGFFLYNGNSKLLEQVGLRYKLSEKWISEFLLKAHGYKADLLHFGVGYTFR